MACSREKPSAPSSICCRARQANSQSPPTRPIWYMVNLFPLLLPQTSPGHQVKFTSTLSLPEPSSEGNDTIPQLFVVNHPRYPTHYCLASLEHCPSQCRHSRLAHFDLSLPSPHRAPLLESHPPYLTELGYDITTLGNTISSFLIQNKNSFKEPSSAVSRKLLLLFTPFEPPTTFTLPNATTKNFPQ
jgi:hypothetical protein